MDFFHQTFRKYCSKAGTSYRDFYFYVPIMSSRCFEFSAKIYHIGLSFVQKIYHFVLHISQIFLWTKYNNHSLLWNYTSISALTECVLSLFMVSKWFLVQLWCFIGGWQISMLKVSLSSQKTLSHLGDYCFNVTLSFPETACPIQPNLAESILICHSSALTRNKFKLDRTIFELIW